MRLGHVPQLIVSKPIFQANALYLLAIP